MEFCNEYFRCYFWNAILGDLHRSKRNAMGFHEELKLISEKFRKAWYPTRFVKKDINQFSKPVIELWFLITAEKKTNSWSLKYHFMKERKKHLKRSLKNSFFHIAQIQYGNKMVNKESQQSFSLKDILMQIWKSPYMFFYI